MHKTSSYADRPKYDSTKRTSSTSRLATSSRTSTDELDSQSKNSVNTHTNVKSYDEQNNGVVIPISKKREGKYFFFI